MTAFHFTRDLHESEGTHALVCEREKIRDLRDCMLDDRAWEGHTREEALQAVLSFQMPDGSFSLVSDYRIPSDARVDFIYDPSYFCCQILLDEFLLTKNEAAAAALKTGLDFCCGRGLRGHGYEDTRDLLRNLKDFAYAGATICMEGNLGLSKRFNSLIRREVRNCRQALQMGHTYAGWSENYLIDMMEVSELYGRDEVQRIFVYGTLMKGMPNHHLVQDNWYRGTATIRGFKMYDLGAFPGIVKTENEEDVVLGECVSCDAATIRRLHELESEGRLYRFKKVEVQDEEGCFHRAWAYELIHLPKDAKEIPADQQPYPRYVEER